MFEGLLGNVLSTCVPREGPEPRDPAHCLPRGLQTGSDEEDTRVLGLGGRVAGQSLEAKGWQQPQ